MDEFEKPPGYKKLEILRCKRCGKIVSENDKACPYCGQIYPSQEKSSSRMLIYVVTIINSSHPKNGCNRLATEIELICFVVTSGNSCGYICEVTPRISIQFLPQPKTPLLGWELIILAGGYYYLEVNDDSGKRAAINIVRKKIEKYSGGSYRFAVDKTEKGYLVDFNNGFAKYRVVKNKVCAINIKAKQIAPSVKMCPR